MGLSVLVDLWFQSFLPPTLKAYLDAESEAPWSGRDTVLLILACGIIVFAIVVTVGLYRFRNWARLGLLISTGLQLVCGPLYGPGVVTGVGGTLDTVVVLVEGAILALAFTPPIRQHFEGQHEV